MSSCVILETLAAVAQCCSDNEAAVNGCVQGTTSLVKQNERRSCLHCMERLASGNDRLL